MYVSLASFLLSCAQYTGTKFGTENLLERPPMTVQFKSTYDLVGIVWNNVVNNWL